MGGAQVFQIEMRNHSRFHLSERELTYSGEGFQKYHYPPRSLSSASTSHCRGNGNVLFGTDYQVFIQYTVRKKNGDRKGIIKLRVIPDGIEVVENSAGIAWSSSGPMIAKTFTFGDRDAELERTERRRTKRDQRRDRVIAAKREVAAYENRLSEEKRKVRELSSSIQSEEKKLEDIPGGPPSAIGADVKRIVVLGLTRIGKSTFCNRLLGFEDGDGPVHTSAGVDGDTQSCREFTRVSSRPKVSIIDTPGLNDPNVRDSDILNNILEYLKLCGGINQFVLVFHAGSAGFLTSHRLVFQYFRERFRGNRFAQYLTVVFTHANESNIPRTNIEERKKKDALVSKIQSTYYRGVSVFESGFGVEQVAYDDFLNRIPSRRFSCEFFVSPLDDLRNELMVARDKIPGLEHDLNYRRQRVDEAEAALRRAQEEFDNAY